MGQFKDYDVEGIVPARIHATIRAMSPEGAIRKAKEIAKHPEKADAGGNWWFSDDGHDLDAVQVLSAVEARS